MIFTTNHAGTLAYLSPGWAEITGQDAEAAANYGWVQAVHLEDRETVRAVVSRAIAEQREFSVRYRLIDTAGRPVCVAAAAMPRHEPHAHTFLGFLGSVSEIVERRPTASADGLVGRLAPLPPGMRRVPTSFQETAAEHILAAQAHTLQASSGSTRRALELAAFEVGRQLAQECGVASIELH
ncbi:PAS domain-containing protein [Methylobacterium segetis]|uniref:PAS domain-containing protein n=1 Tax=Methylobacterium segetis TaxID=2488750 RepID=UPI001404D8E8|nr:PAS domain-containing protein [Methylobacterium segetis]